MKIVAVIPVRGGSKSIPLKNIKLLNGRPLVYWTIDAALQCKWIDEVYISTDSEEIKKCVNQYDRKHNKQLFCVDRDVSTATDFATTESVLLDFIHRVDSEVIILLQATSPLTNYKQLNEAFEKYFKNHFDSMLSVVEQKRFIWEKVDNLGTIKALNYSINQRPRRQEFEGFLVENGAFYITKTELLKETKTRISGKIGMYKMPEETYFEIDEPDDWLIVENLMKNQKEKLKKLSEIKLFAMDCDGVLTDGGMYYSAEGDMLKKFNTKDGMGIGELRKKGILTAILTGENSQIVSQRAKKLQIEEVYLGCKNKVDIMEQILLKYNLSYDEVAYIGDDINDVELLQKVGISFTVKDAVESVRKIAHYVTSRKGGEGAVREAIDYLLENEE